MRQVVQREKSRKNCSLVEINYFGNKIRKFQVGKSSHRNSFNGSRQWRQCRQRLFDWRHNVANSSGDTLLQIDEPYFTTAKIVKEPYGCKSSKMTAETIIKE